MAMLKTIGAYVESSGIDMCWIESEVYRPATVKQILDRKHVKLEENAHMTTLQAFFSFYIEEFLKKITGTAPMFRKFGNVVDHDKEKAPNVEK